MMINFKMLTKREKNLSFEQEVKIYFHISNVLPTPIAVRIMVVLTASSVENFCPNC